MHLDWQIKHYRDLSTNEFHDLIALRLKAFVLEQNVAYLDLDGKDKKSYHVICRDGKGDIVSTARILPPGVSFKDVGLGRIVVNDAIRGEGVGKELLKQCVEFSLAEFGNTPVFISAQKHLEEYYSKLNFESTGKEYEEGGVPHVEMKFEH